MLRVAIRTVRAMPPAVLLSPMLVPVLATLIAPTALAQGNASRPWTRTLTTPAAEVAEPFSAIGGVRELRDGRVLVVDRREKAVRMVNTTTGAVTQVGREGSGPGEYGLPMMLMPLPGDSTLLFDGVNARYQVIDPAGEMAGSFSLAGEARPGALAIGLPRGADGAGRLYFLQRNFMSDPAGRADSAAIVRYDRGRKAVDTVTYVGMPPAVVQSSGGGGQRNVRITMAAPFTPQDEWAVGSDGRVALVRVADYRVEWVAPNGQRVRGPAHPYTPVKVTSADRDAIREQRQRGGGMAVVRTIGGPPGGGSGAQSAGSAQLPPPDVGELPDVKPPFTSGAAVVAPDGALWVLRTRPAEDKVPSYDVFDSFGRRVGRVVLPRDTRLAGFGQRSVYLVRTDADDLEYLQRYAM